MRELLGSCGLPAIDSGASLQTAAGESVHHTVLIMHENYTLGEAHQPAHTLLLLLRGSHWSQNQDLKAVTPLCDRFHIRDVHLLIPRESQPPQVWELLPYLIMYQPHLMYHFHT